MKQALEGSQAIARAVALCRPDVVAAYPITPQTHIVEGIAKLVADGELNCEYVSVESEHSAASVALGAAAAGARAYTATASQGILLMSEVLYDIAGMRIPMVLTCANRAVSAPLSIWNDHQDAMAVRDAGWIQLYSGDNQEAVDMTIQAFHIAQDTELPVMVCVDGFTLTHTLEPIDLPAADEVAAYLPPYRFSRALDSAKPLSLGTMATPEWYAEARHSHHGAVLDAASMIKRSAIDWQTRFGRGSAGLVESNGPDDARIGIVCMGSVYGTLLDAREQQPELPGCRLIRLRSFRPFPREELCAACAGLDQLIVLERAISPGGQGVVAPEVRAALYGCDAKPRIQSFAVGLGGRDMPLALYERLIRRSQAKQAVNFAVLDVDLNKLPQEDRYREFAAPPLEPAP